jgi:uncharacterized protein
LLTEDKIIFLKNNNFNISISLDGPEHIHDRYRLTLGRRPTFKIIMDNIKIIKLCYQDYYLHKIGYNITLAPPYDLISIIDFFSSEDVFTECSHRYNFVSNRDTTFYSRFNVKEISNILSKQREYLRNQFYSLLSTTSFHDNSTYRRFRILMDFFLTPLIRFHHRPLGFVKHIYPNGICTPGGRKVFVTSDGYLCACEKIDYDMLIGDIYNGFNLERINDFINSYVDACRDENCNECWIKRLCDMCYINMFEANRISVESKTRICKYKKRSIAKSLIEYCNIMEINQEIFKNTSYK